MFIKHKIIKFIMLSLLSPILWILLDAEEPYVVIEAWGLLITGSSIITLGYALTLLRQLFKECKNGKYINIIYILWLMSILYVLMQIPYYYLADLQKSYEWSYEGSDKEWLEDVGCLMWYDDSCGRGKRCLKGEGKTCVCRIDEEKENSFVRCRKEPCEGAE
ncbi:MAG: hypothetical protein BWK78_08475 [Thiotrichaceae bacterium IS1]|nr:MAG: hypothetical protein BWK78_08475 [Thiotrichaceae bacterium IS1]